MRNANTDFQTQILDKYFKGQKVTYEVITNKEEVADIQEYIENKSEALATIWTDTGKDFFNYNNGAWEYAGSKC